MLMSMSQIFAPVTLRKRKEALPPPAYEAAWI